MKFICLVCWQQQNIIHSTKFGRIYTPYAIRSHFDGTIYIPGILWGCGQACRFRKVTPLLHRSRKGTSSPPHDLPAKFQTEWLVKVPSR